MVKRCYHDKWIEWSQMTTTYIHIHSCNYLHEGERMEALLNKISFLLFYYSGKLTQVLRDQQNDPVMEIWANISRMKYQQYMHLPKEHEGPLDSEAASMRAEWVKKAQALAESLKNSGRKRSLCFNCLQLKVLNSAAYSTDSGPSHVKVSSAYRYWSFLL